MDGINAGVMATKQKISIICHSLGCFHTYEAIHYAVNHPEHNLTPATDGFRFANIIYMASPVQLIRTIAYELGMMVPDGLATMDPVGLYCPWETGLDQKKVYSVKKWVSISGDLDPVAGFLFHKKMNWAYMNVPAQNGFDGQEPIIDKQTWLNISTEEALMKALLAALDPNSPPDIKINNPHSWEGYVKHHQEGLKKWLSA
jgi:pimeloyl-ACP methyl ester carboxylesterase